MSKPEDQTDPQDLESAKTEVEQEDTIESVEGELETAEEAAAEAGSGEENPLQAELESALAEVQKFRDVALRAEAEMENVRRRATMDVEKAHKFGAEKLVQNLLPVVDSLEKAIESAEQAEGAAEGTYKAIVEGVGICHKMLMDTLGKEGVVAIDPHGEPFDPNQHQAMSMVENPDVEPNSVVAVIQKGYSLNERLVRPAMVMVAKGAAPKIDETA